MTDLAYCEDCNGPNHGRSDLTLDLSHIAYWVWMRLPDWLAFSRLGFAMLPWAGNVAFACSCRDKNHAMRARSGPARPGLLDTIPKWPSLVLIAVATGFLVIGDRL